MNEFRDHKCFLIRYKRNVAVRVPAYGGMDSDFSHYEVREFETRGIAPSEQLARAYVEHRYKQHDDKFEILSVTEEPMFEWTVRGSMN